MQRDKLSALRKRIHEVDNAQDAAAAVSGGLGGGVERDREIERLEVCLGGISR